MHDQQHAAGRFGVDLAGKREAASLVHDESGAILVMGLFFAVLTAGLLYYVMGLGNAIWYRERLQDAADAAAFGGAVVHARGMNLLALINMIMAALLSILVTLKLVTALITIAEVILWALSWFFGATAGIAAALEVLREEVVTATDTAEPIIAQALEALHGAGEVVRVVVPIGANASVIPLIGRQYGMTAVSIPSRLTLPVDDDEYKYLCGKAGVMAATLALAPLSPILPDGIESKIKSGMEKLTTKLSGWFCGEEGAEAPTMSMEDFDMGDVDQPWPMSDDREACGEYANRFERDDATVTAGEGQRLCNIAERTDMLASPDPTTGDCRVNQPVCVPVPDVESPTGFLEPRPESYCANAGQSERVTAADCALAAGSAYGDRLLQARRVCMPDGRRPLNGYWWLQKQITVWWRWNPDPERANGGYWTSRDDRDTARVESVHRNNSDAGNYGEIPCNYRPGGTITWDSTHLDQNVCSTEAAAPVEAPVLYGLRGSPLDGNNELPPRHHVEVTQVLGCNERTRPPPVQVGSLNLGEDAIDSVSSEGGGAGGTGGVGSGAGGAGGAGGGSQGGSGSGGGGSKNPFRFQKGHKLGTSDLQVRSLVFEESIEQTNAFADKIVRVPSWGRARNVQQQPFINMAHLWGRFSFAQAEYYFDGTGVGDDSFCDPNNPRDWLWYIGWTARLRRFRLNWTGHDENGNEINADGDSENQGDDTRGAFEFAMPDLVNQLQPGGQAVNGMNPACSGADCGSATNNMNLFQNLFLH